MLAASARCVGALRPCVRQGMSEDLWIVKYE
jgi:hypothetical protein